ncbi:pyridoxal phosphate-dependent aminotransferase [Acuticoccus sp. I52.16.1]|uniref:pyridoxal phosphate-dependent aminotransferase n=1 Tax=Acuticoccus sp. I52.16.1 TaxID=2928472 RepID=UPI001FD24B28|nr:pyridoxal phosphate-dependent aminotransferase [Acuticoccus sp. I52.16.1]UOM36298.1 pyridoxal phosphate-dependent aminotransferase [Acuticoccus sp. I52.16.1]
MLPLTPLAAALPSTVPFVGPEAQERARGAAFRARIGANENAFGASPQVAEAIAAAGPDAWQYGDPENFELKQALGAHYGISPARIGVGEGIDGILQVIARLFVTDGTAVVTSAGAYPTFNYHVNGFGGRLVTVPYAGDHEDPDALVEAAHRERAALVYLANPDNPMGTWHDADRLAAMIDRLPDHAVLVLDEAYVEFAPAAAQMPMMLEHPRLIRLRTFSKAYGLAGLRVGYAVTTPEMATAFDKVRNHFGVNRIAQVAALAALHDQAWLRHMLAEVDAAKVRIGAIAAAHGLTALPSATNFVALDTGRDGTVARALVAALSARGVFVRMPFVAPQNRCIRVTAAPDAALDVLDAELAGAMAEATEVVEAAE